MACEQARRDGTTIGTLMIADSRNVGLSLEAVGGEAPHSKENHQQPLVLLVLSLSSIVVE